MVVTQQSWFFIYLLQAFSPLTSWHSDSYGITTIDIFSFLSSKKCIPDHVKANEGRFSQLLSLDLFSHNLNQLGRGKTNL